MIKIKKAHWAKLTELGLCEHFTSCNNGTGNPKTHIIATKYDCKLSALLEAKGIEPYCICEKGMLEGEGYQLLPHKEYDTKWQQLLEIVNEAN